MKLALVGVGRMGRAVEAVAEQKGHRVTAWLDSRSHEGGLAMTTLLASEARVAIDFSTPSAVVENVRAATGVGLDVVVGTTGWYDRLDEVRSIVEAAGRGLIYAPNFALGVQLFFRVARAAARLADRLDEYDVHVAEAHHRHKLDHPSGTAIRLAELVLSEVSRKSRWSERLPDGPVDPDTLQVSVARVGEEPGTHLLGLDGPDDRIEIRHRARSRMAFARGAVEAAAWVHGREGLFTMDDFLADRFGPDLDAAVASGPPDPGDDPTSSGG